MLRRQSTHSAADPVVTPQTKSNQVWATCQGSYSLLSRSPNFIAQICFDFFCKIGEQQVLSWVYFVAELVLREIRNQFVKQISEIFVFT